MNGIITLEISAALRNVTLLYVETAPFIYYTEGRIGHVDKMRAVFQYLLDGQIEITTSAITLTECLTKPIKDQLISLVQNYSVLFENTQGINVVPIDSTIGRRAAELRARYNLRTPDALHIATAIRTSCDAFLTNDFGIRRVTEIPILIPDELELDS